MKNNLIPKLLSIIFIFTTILFPANIANAAQPSLVDGKVVQTTTTFSEYEAYQYYISLTDKELIQNGFTSDDISYLRNLDYKAELLKRSKLPKDKLKSLGYSDSQINKLKSYNGSDNVQPYLTAQATIYSNIYSASPTQFKVSFRWDWTSCPVFIRTDMIAVVWSGTNSSGLPMNVAINKSSSATYHNVTYYDTYTGKYTTESKTVTPKNEYAGASSSFSMGYNYGDGYMRWANYGSGMITVASTNGSPIDELLMRFEYGHTYIAGSPSFSISGSGASIGISFNLTTATEDYSSHRYKSNGTTVS
ncbi:MAG: hypothetical protein ACRC1T_03315 [Clostridium chrysemydis]|uniref:hypothetical protein n=1 Tax=Clostridium chrysemydis TaxID=2665504 RepID=UPI003F394732